MELLLDELLEDEPQLINSGPYDEGWLFEIQPSNISELEDLMSASEYQTSTEE